MTKSKPDSPKRLIDQRRDSAGMMEVGLREEGPITSMITFGDERMLMIKERAAYEITFADRIDPERTNEEIPNIQQRVLRAGSDNILVQRVMLNSEVLFNPTYLSNFDCGALRENALNAVREILAMERIAERLTSEEKGLIEELQNEKLRNGLIIPSLSDLEQEIKNFLQRADHFTRELFRIIRAFEPGFGNLDNLLRRAKNEKPPDDGFVAILTRAVPFLKFVREARNAVEHPSAQKRVVVRDFELDKAGQLIVPTIEVVHPKHAEPRVPVSTFVEEMIRSLAAVFGELVAILAARNAALGGFDVNVISLSDEQRRHPGVEYGYALQIDGKWQPIG